ncbi:MAG: glucose-6-phosphate dehydrogenase assembly protein OpcA [Verrucomicrobiae bacterium]|nr:glucose-6-phosphate dehydrogenase assembly protein OpcA [Verrucomicrobiae bacterium]NNJ86424.1 glucose-6-phosphate dehydrogenase assembly protein OpcA [Akkermansiaceae bacterium]
MSDYTDEDYAIALGKEVPIAEVDRELRLLWEEDKASTNASLINLAVYSEQEGAIIRNSELVQAITREHACRALLIGIDRDNPRASIRAWITAHCHLSQGRKSVCCEQIAFQLTGKATGRLRNTVFAHLSSDLPLVFWWQGELSPIFSERLYSLIDRFVFDSSDWSEPAASFRCIEQVMADEKDLLPMDVEWTRSYQIRHAIAGLFDDPMAAAALEHLRTIRIIVHPDHQMAGLQLLAWIIQRTGWSRSLVLGLDTEHGGTYYFETTEGSDVTATLETNSAGAPVSLIEMTSPQCTARVAREEGSAYLHQQLDAGSHQIDRCTPANSDDPAELVMNQLSRGGKNTLYRSMMPVFLELLGAEGDCAGVISTR